MPELSPDTIGEVVRVCNADGQGDVVVICEHASARIPAVLNGLGLASGDRESHAVWDPGALEMAEEISAALDAPLVYAQISRLVYDLNRPPDAPGAMAAISELVKVPGNKGLSQAARDQRIALIYDPFRAAVDRVLDARAARGKPTAIITIHTFTPVYFGADRPTEIGILHDRDTRLADGMLSAAKDRSGFRVDRNQPYGPEDGVSHSLRLYGIARSLPNVMIEVRNDLVTTPEGCSALAQELLTLLRPALAGGYAAAEDKI